MSSTPTVVIDLGSYKISCFIINTDDNGETVILGHAQRQSQGITKGIISNMDLVADAVQDCINTATSTAKVPLKNRGTLPAIFNIHCDGAHSEISREDIPLHGQPVGTGSISGLYNKFRQHYSDPNAFLLHAYNLGYQIDGGAILQKVLQSHGNVLSLNVHMVNIKKSTHTNFITLAGRCHLTLVRTISSAIAPAPSCLNDKEYQHGVILVDLGHETTKFSIFHHGHCIHTDFINLGGKNITKDIAQIFNISENHAQGIKHHHGRLISSLNDHKETFTITQNNGETKVVSVSYLTNVIRPRVDEILDFIQHRIEQSEFDHIGNIVFTGGSARLHGLEVLTQKKLHKSARIAMNIDPLSPNNFSMVGLEFSSLYGLIRHLKFPTDEVRDRIMRHRTMGQSALGKTWLWIRDNF